MRLIAMTTLMLALGGGIALAQAPSGGGPSGAAPSGSSPGTASPRATSPGGLTQPGATNPSANTNTGASTPGAPQPPQSSVGSPTPGGANSSAQSRDNKTGKNALNEEYTDCMRLWDAGTHMSKQEWSATCRRVQSRLNQVQSK